MRIYAVIASAAALALGAGAARAETLVVCSEASPDYLNSALTDSNTSFDLASRSPTGWSRWRSAGPR